MTAVGSEHQSGIPVRILDVERQSVIEELHQLIGAALSGKIHRDRNDPVHLFVRERLHEPSLGGTPRPGPGMTRPAWSDVTGPRSSGNLVEPPLIGPDFREAGRRWSEPERR